MKKMLLLGLCVFSSTIVAASYNPSQLLQFQRTGTCLNCDFTNTHVSVDQTVKPPYHLWHTNLSSATFAVANNTLSDFTMVTAIHTNFAGGDYSQAAFVNAVLIDANFSHADLSYSNFAGANVTGADFSYANLYGSQGINPSKAASVCKAIMPDGSIGKCG